MSELSLSDQLDRMELEDIEEGAKAAIEAMKKSLTNSYEHMIRVGHFLNAMKAKLPHGAWGPWLQENFDDSRQWAHKLMTCAADRANVKSTLQMTTVSTIEQHYSMLMNTPEKQAKRAEREAKKRETPPISLAPATPAPPVSSGVIRDENPPAAAPPVKPEWLADPDELDRPEEDDLPPLPKTNTHHTSANRRTPDARETDRAGIVCPDDPRGLTDGGWYVWSEERNRLLPVTDEDVLRRFDQIRRERAPKAGQVMVVPESPAITTPVVEPVKESVSSKPGKVPTVQQLTTAVGDRVHDGDWQDLWRGKLEKAVEAWARYKQSLTGKAKVRSMESWEAALGRIENVAHDRGVDVVCDMIEKAIANGWQGWEHETSGSRGGSRISTAVRSNRNWDEEIPEWKPTE